MAYEVTATRKRPQNFDQMAGQDFIVTTLKASLTSGRIAHAYLFSGPRGVGKTSAARILARSLNCDQGPTESPCGTCANCREIALGNSLDVIEIDGASNTSVNDVREIKDEVLFSPNSSRYKIYIIDEVHMLSNSAFNALLKTIEEPPPYVIFIFATTEVHKVPATIRSRCQQFNFRLISIETIKSLLADLVSEGGLEAEDDALFWIAKEATGSLRDAYTLFDQIVSFSDDGITLALIREKLGLVGLDRMNEIAELLVEGKANEAMQITEEILIRGVSVEQFVVDLAEYFRCILFIRHGIKKESLLGYKSDRFSEAVHATLSDVQIEKALELIFQLYRDLRFSLSQRFELELLLSRLSLITSYIHQKDLLAQIAAMKKELQDAGIRTKPRTVPDSSTKDSGGARKGAGSGQPTDAPDDIRDVAAAVDETQRTKTATEDTATSEQEPHAASAQSAATEAVHLESEPPLSVPPLSVPPLSVPPQAVPPQAVPPQMMSAQSASLEPTHQRDTGSPAAAGTSQSEIAETEETTGDRQLGEREREMIMSAIRKKHLSLASSLEKVTSWRVEGDSLVLTCRNNFDTVNIRREQQKMLESVSGALGRPYRIELRGSPENGEDTDPDGEAGSVGESVEMMRRVFRGEIVEE